MKYVKSICIIPARGGSKRIPRKNVRKLNGVPLLAYSIRAAKEANVFSKIIVSTDDPEIKAVALDEGVKVDDRPEHMATDTATKVQVVEEYVQRTNAKDDYDIVVAMLPTCPFRTSEDVQNAYALFTSQEEYKFLIGVTEYEFPVQLALKDLGGDLVTMNQVDGYQTTRSQNIEKMYHPNGAIYMATMDVFLEKRTFFNEEMLSYKMPAIRSFDIDYPYQFEMAEMLMKLRKKTPEIFL
jgi:CMP-N-acetylneuraminic acid synthetase